MLVPPESSSAVLVMMRSKFVSIATVFTLDEAILVKTISKGGYPCLLPSFEGSPHPAAPNHLVRN